MTFYTTKKGPKKAGKRAFNIISVDDDDFDAYPSKRRATSSRTLPPSNHKPSNALPGPPVVSTPLVGDTIDDDDFDAYPSKRRATPSRTLPPSNHKPSNALPGPPVVSTPLVVNTFDDNNFNKKRRTELTFAESALATATRTPPATRATRRSTTAPTYQDPPSPHSDDFDFEDGDFDFDDGDFDFDDDDFEVHLPKRRVTSSLTLQPFSHKPSSALPGPPVVSRGFTHHTIPPPHTLLDTSSRPDIYLDSTTPSNAVLDRIGNLLSGPPAVSRGFTDYTIPTPPTLLNKPSRPDVFLDSASVTPRVPIYDTSSDPLSSPPRDLRSPSRSDTTLASTALVKTRKSSDTLPGPPVTPSLAPLSRPVSKSRKVGSRYIPRLLRGPAGFPGTPTTSEHILVPLAIHTRNLNHVPKQTAWLPEFLRLAAAYWSISTDQLDAEFGSSWCKRTCCNVLLSCHAWFPRLSFRAIVVAIKSAARLEVVERVLNSEKTGHRRYGKEKMKVLPQHFYAAFEALRRTGAPDIEDDGAPMDNKYVSSIVVHALQSKPYRDAVARSANAKRHYCRVPGCGAHFGYPSELVGHMQQHYGTGASCSHPGCDTVLKSTKFLAAHQQIHDKIIEAGKPRNVPQSEFPIFGPSTNLKVSKGMDEVLGELGRLMSKFPSALTFMTTFRTPVGTFAATGPPPPGQLRPIAPRVPATTWPSFGCARSDAMFARFRQEEVGLSGLPESELVSPSGRLDSPLIVRVNYPNFDNRHHHYDYATTADVFSVSLSTLMIKLGVFDPASSNQVLFTENCCRRLKRLTVGETLTKRLGMDVTACHMRFGQELWDASSARFGLLCGDDSKDQYQVEHPRSQFVPFLFRSSDFNDIGDVDDDYVHVPMNWSGLYLEYDSSSSDNQVRRMVFVTGHPEYLHRASFVRTAGFPSTDQHHLKLMMLDAMIDAAVILALGRVPTIDLCVANEVRYKPMKVRQLEENDSE
ncbi:hypothetical protein J4E80_008879 [Alternaria sp. BMP 0032]|nr:hypothetical protein J4E80_008879 [Alternaria sp. BMP 0032]